MRYRIHNVTMVRCWFIVTVYMLVNPVLKFLMRFTAMVFHYTEHNRHIHAFFIPRFHCKCTFFSKLIMKMKSVIGYTVGTWKLFTHLNWQSCESCAPYKSKMDMTIRKIM